MNTFSISIKNNSPIIFKEVKLQIDKSKLYNFRSCKDKKNKYGDCDFCNFSIADKLEIPASKALYCFFINDEVVHIGQVETNIVNVINNGFGKITQSKCLVNGTSTFCHINSLIASDNARLVQLFICSTNENENLALIKKAIIEDFPQKEIPKEIITKISPLKQNPQVTHTTHISFLIENFFNRIISTRNIEIYNEFSLQHELGIYLRESLPEYKVQFERNISFFTKTKPCNTIKKEIDISIFQNNGEKYAIELKFPQNGQYPEQMYSFVKDLKFMEQLKENFEFSHTYCVTLVSDKNFYSPTNKSDGIYKYFRNENKVYGKIFKPTGKGKEQDFIDITNIHEFTWAKFDDSSKRYYIIEI